MTTRVTDLFITSDHATRPAANTVPVGSLHSCTTHGLITKSDGTNWNPWFDPSIVQPTINTQTGTTYTLAASDAGKFVTMSNAAASTLTVPANSTVSFPIGTLIEGAQMGSGQVTLAAAAGVTINSSPGLKVATQYGTFALRKLGTDTWLAYGRLSA